MSKDFETRCLAMKEKGTNKQKVLDTLADLGLQNVHGYVCPITKTLTNKDVMNAFIVEVTGPKQCV